MDVESVQLLPWILGDPMMPLFLRVNLKLERLIACGGNINMANRNGSLSHHIYTPKNQKVLNFKLKFPTHQGKQIEETGPHC